MKIKIGDLRRIVTEAVDASAPIVNSWMIQMRRASGEPELLDDMAKAWDDMVAAAGSDPSQKMQLARKIAAERGLQPALISFHITKVMSYAKSAEHPPTGEELKAEVEGQMRSRAAASEKSAKSSRRAFELAAEQGIRPDNSYEYAEGGAYYREKRAYDNQVAAIRAAYDPEGDTFDLEKYRSLVSRAE